MYGFAQLQARSRLEVLYTDPRCSYSMNPFYDILVKREAL